jgi:predicted GIY-YIG superfamily endonuclease
MKTYSVYCLERSETRVDDFIAFYVGITCNPRSRRSDHRCDRRHNHHSNLIRKVIRTIGYLPLLIVASGLTKKEAKRLEIEMIAAFRQYDIPLTNKTAGGDHPAPMTPPRLSPR